MTRTIGEGQKGSKTGKNKNKRRWNHNKILQFGEVKEKQIKRKSDEYLEESKSGG